MTAKKRATINYPTVSAATSSRSPGKLRRGIAVSEPPLGWKVFITMTCWLHLSSALSASLPTGWESVFFLVCSSSVSFQIVVNRPPDRVPTETLWLKRHSSSAQTHLMQPCAEIQSAAETLHSPELSHNTCAQTHTCKNTKACIHVKGLASVRLMRCLC